jgi:N4-(beta-N-acetylglucosaminyl)-L-asparaginase
MSGSKLTRRTIIATGAAAAAGALLPVPPARGQDAALQETTLKRGPSAVRPVAIAAHNGLAAVKLAVERMTAGAAPVDAAVAGVGLVEADPDDVTVGYGGLPNEEGVVQLDAAVMDGTTMRAGAVASLEGIMHPAQVALEIMRRTTRILLVGRGAKKFALDQGFKEQDLLTERARKIWLYWKENAAPKDDWLPSPAEAADPDIKWYIEKYGDADFRPCGTIHLSCCNAEGQLGCCTTTSGLFFKMDGRVGDSPLIGCGLYCDSEVGSAGSTGHGETCMVTVGSHTVVEFMRQGLSPEEACLATLQRAVKNTRLSYLRDAKGRPANDLLFYAVDRLGRTGAASMWSDRQYTLCRAGSAPEKREAAYLFKRKTR